MMVFRARTLALALVFIWFALSLGSYARLDSGPCWLLSSSWSQYLSGSGQSALEVVCAPWTQAEWQTVLHLPSLSTASTRTPPRVSRSGNILVNNPNTDTPEHTTQSETTIALFSETVLVAFVDTGQFLPRRPGVSSLSGIARSSDRGESFIDMGQAPPHPRALGISDPSLAVDSQGNFYISTIQQVPGPPRTESYLGVAKSTDGGQTFSPAVLIAGTGPTTVAFQDKELIAVDNTGSPHDGNVYMAWTEFGPEAIQVLFVRSTDGGRTFSKPVVISDGRSAVQGATPAVGAQGEVYVLWINFSPRTELRLRQSLDGGQTFGPERVVAPIRTGAHSASSNTCRRRALNGNIRYLELPSMAVDLSRQPSRGTIYVAYPSAPDGDRSDAADVFLVRSTDGGETWSEPVRVHDDETKTDQFQPAVAVARDGTVGVIFYDRRHDPNNLSIDLYMARSTDGGRTFERNFRVTDRSFPVPPIALNGANFDALRSICYMGDYNWMVADDVFFYLTWGDNRMTLFTERFPAPAGRPDPNVFLSRIPVRGDPTQRVPPARSVELLQIENHSESKSQTPSPLTLRPQDPYTR
jgi:hypothetical protein